MRRETRMPRAPFRRVVAGRRERSSSAARIWPDMRTARVLRSLGFHSPDSSTDVRADVCTRQRSSAPVAADQLAVSDTTVSDTLLTNAPLVPVLASGKIVGDDGDNVLEQGERWVYALNATGTPVVQVATTCADVVNSAKVAVTSGDTDLTNNKATRTTPVACVPDIAIDKSGRASVNFGGTITYTVDASNVGDPAADCAGGPASDRAGETWTYSLPGAPLTLAANQCTPTISFSWRRSPCR